MDECVFCKIIEGKIPAVKIFEDEICIAVLDKFPSSNGQTLVIPKKHEIYFAKMEDSKYNHIFSIAKKVTKAIDSSLKPKRTCLVVEGFEVPHVHIKLFPCYENKLNMNGKIESDEILKETARLIKAKID